MMNMTQWPFLIVMTPSVINRTRYRMMPPPMRISTADPVFTGGETSAPGADTGALSAPLLPQSARGLRTRVTPAARYTRRIDGG